MRVLRFNEMKMKESNSAIEWDINSVMIHSIAADD
jgi:hypothetical protein